MLTKRQKQLLNFIETYIEENDYSPSIEEMAEYLNLSSMATIHEHLKNLKTKRLITWEHNRPRSVQLKEEKNRDSFPIRIVGTITAGKPIEAIEIPEETINVSREGINKQGTYYALKVEGDSMIKEGIFDGDIVVIKKQNTAENGQTVVAIIDENEATLKKFYKEKDKVRLQPANPSLLPIYRKEVEIRGIVVRVIRDMQKNTLRDRKEKFLKRIKSLNSNSRNKYKRVMETPLRYAGGKSLAIGHIVELLPDDVDKLVSPFMGGGSVEIAISKHLGIEVEGYDIFDILMNYWDVQINKPEALFKKLSELNPDKETYKKVKSKLKDHWEDRKKIKSALELAAYYYFNHNLSYGPGFLGWPSSVYLDKKRYSQMLEKVRSFNPRKLRVGTSDFEEVIKKHPNDFLYCDPPYLLGEETQMFRGIYPMRNIPVHHNGFGHEKLLGLLKKHKGGFMLSYNNCPSIREWYKDFEQYFPSWQYTMGQGETRIGENRKNGNGSHVKKSHEILIFSPPSRK